MGSLESVLGKSSRESALEPVLVRTALEAALFFQAAITYGRTIGTVVAAVTIVKVSVAIVVEFILLLGDFFGLEISVVLFDHA